MRSDVVEPYSKNPEIITESLHFCPAFVYALLAVVLFW
jgi:hypothetical protein